MKNKINYGMLSFLQFILSILVIMFHCSRVFESNAVHFIQTNLFGRMAVPFFIVCSSFFIRMKTENNPSYQKYYIKRYIKMYLLWTIIFLPYGLIFFNSLALPLYTLPFMILAAILYVGMCYHLWYLPAFITGLYLVNWTNKKVLFEYVGFISFILYLIGSIETYSAYLENTFLLSAYLNYSSIFYTTRNGLFFMPIFICVGYLLYDYRDHLFLKHYNLLKLLLSFLFLCIEGWFIFRNQGIDKNFLIMLIPFTFFLFNWAIRTNVFREQSFKLLKDLSMLYFFLHPIFIEISRKLIVHNLFYPISVEWFEVIFTLFSTHMAAILILYFKKLIKVDDYKRELI